MKQLAKKFVKLLPDPIDFIWLVLHEDGEIIVRMGVDCYDVNPYTSITNKKSWISSSYRDGGHWAYQRRKELPEGFSNPEILRIARILGKRNHECKFKFDIDKREWIVIFIPKM